jgi:hypothetical protein
MQAVCRIRVISREARRANDAADVCLSHTPALARLARGWTGWKESASRKLSPAQMAVSAVVSPAATAAPHADDDNAKSTALDPAALATRQDIEQNLAMLSAKESDLDEQLANLIQSRGRLTSQLRALENLRQVVRGISDEAGHMANEVAVVAETADRVGAKVRGLDEEQVRLGNGSHCTSTPETTGL